MNEWTTTKPVFDKECLVLTVSKIGEHWEYHIYQIDWVDSCEGFYLGWLQGDGEEYGDLNDMTADKYFLMDLLD